MTRTRRILTAVMAVVLATGLTACGGDAEENSGAVDTGGTEGTDDGAKLTLWTRAPLEAQAKLLVDAYNKSHKNQVELTIVPNDDYVAKVGAAAGSGDLPDLFAADIVYVPNWTEAGLFADLTQQIDALPYVGQINKGHLEAGTREGKKYVLPFVLDLSVMFWNKDLYREAGLDPEKGPANLTEFKDHALAIQKLNKKGTYGTSFGGNCGGCGVFTWFPMVWASGEEVMNADGTESLLAGNAAKQVYSTWRDLWAAGAVDPSSRDETGATWVAGFQEGRIGVMPYPATLLATADKTVKVGVTPLPGVSGGASTFVGGDGIGISKDSQKTAQAWNFLSWMMSEDAQVKVLAANNTVVSRADLADNEYSRKDPRVLAINEVAGAPASKTPVAKNFQQAFNAAGSPWVALFRDQVFAGGTDPTAGNSAITEVLGQ
ncbi:ABC transporter substrate-binding protein [Actinoplanes aureus]|uniref:Sugar ABC transporter substrate-binding protein n=1 Tax=Actinoplanes aureus TaxID=2792083 RepID=A0A931CH87_9ACTN|nr:sugar ABC transporter substrate-binding protein [Actinoplanes aureus]MBG0567962.1 sugar ABC transporter substrate-binding protein [Actinoplanes aureus]